MSIHWLIHKYGRITLGLLISLGTVVWLGVRQHRLDQETSDRMRRWIRTPAQVTDWNRVVENKRCSGGKSSACSVRYEADLGFRYEVAGSSYTHVQYQLGQRNPEFRSREEAEAWLKRHPVGSTLWIHYDPDDPDSAVMNLPSAAEARRFKTRVLGVASVVLIALLGLMVLDGAWLRRGQARWAAPAARRFAAAGYPGLTLVLGCLLLNLAVLIFALSGSFLGLTLAIPALYFLVRQQVHRPGIVHDQRQSTLDYPDVVAYARPMVGARGPWALIRALRRVRFSLVELTSVTTQTERVVRGRDARTYHWLTVSGSGGCVTLDLASDAELERLSALLRSCIDPSTRSTERRRTRSQESVASSGA